MRRNHGNTLWWFHSPLRDMPLLYTSHCCLTRSLVQRRLKEKWVFKVLLLCASGQLQRHNSYVWLWMLSIKMSSSSLTQWYSLILWRRQTSRDFNKLLGMDKRTNKQTNKHAWWENDDDGGGRRREWIFLMTSWLSLLRKLLFFANWTFDREITR